MVGTVRFAEVEIPRPVPVDHGNPLLARPTSTAHSQVKKTEQAVVGVDVGLPTPVIQARNRAPRTPKRNFNRIHALPLPLKVYPLPTLFPHNPLSILSVVLTYILQSIVRPSSHLSPRYKAFYNAETQSIHVKDSPTIRALWEMGFFGKGSLSRSEPSWLDKEKRRRGLLAQETSEEVTRKRRQERKDFKNERAKKEREAIEEKLVQEGKLSISVSPLVGDLDGDSSAIGARLEPRPGAAARASSETVETNVFQPASHDSMASAGNPHCGQSPGEKGPRHTLQKESVSSSPDYKGDFQSTEQVEDIEHLQLTHEEALFLVYGLGVLDVFEEATNSVIQTDSLLPIFRRQSYFPPYAGSSLPPDDPFMLSYVVYHHFRSLGWVVRPGMKFAVDYLLYNRGPVFAHAEFAVVTVPSYEHPYYSSAEAQRDKITANRSKDWWWLHCVNRVQAQVHKNLVLVYVEVPPPAAADETDDSIPSTDDTNLTDQLRRYKVREFSLKRWTPNRGRD